MIRDRRAGDINEQTPISATFALDDEDKASVSSALGEGILTGDHLEIKRKYNSEIVLNFEYSQQTAIKNLVASFSPKVQSLFKKTETLEQVNAILANPAIHDGDEETAEGLSAAEKIINERSLDKIGLRLRIAQILEARLPQFFRFTSYNTLPGRIDFHEIASAQVEGPARSGLQTARALMSLAGTDVKQLGNEDYELRKGELEAVQIDLTAQVFEYWKQNPDLEVLIDVDKETVQQPNGTMAVARFLDIRLRDKRSGYSNNFSQRSAGFQWFFSFFAAFSEFEGQKSPIILLDEPGLTSHGKAQRDFLRFINERLAPNSPVIYTTHSPFMVEADRLDRVRIIEDHGPPVGATSTREVLAADADSLFPLQAALGYDIAQNLFVGPHNLVVEGTSDYIYLTTMSRICVASGREAIDERWRILPVGGATNIPTFVSLVGPHLNVTVLADSDTKGMQRVTNMIERKLLEGHRLIMANIATTSEHADIEDLFSEGDYLKLFNKT